MCLLTYYPPGVMPDHDRLTAGSIVNDDGHGFAIVDNDAEELIIHKGMIGAEVIEAFETMRAVHLDSPAIFHSRIGTAGHNNVDNCHPFYVGRDKRTVIAHNGILPGSMQPAAGSPWSDTRLLAARGIPARFGPLWLPRNQQRLADAITGYNKIVILTANPIYRKQAIILNEKQGSWRDEVWYSNDSYEWGMPRQWSPDKFNKLGRFIRKCRPCGRSLFQADITCGYCNWCEACVQCDEPWAECECYGEALTQVDGPLCWCQSGWPERYCHNTSGDRPSWWDDAKSPIIVGTPQATHVDTGKELVPVRPGNIVINHVDDRGSIVD